MACDRAADVHRFHDDEVSVRDRALVEEHIEECAECGRLFQELGALSALLKRAALAEAPADLMVELRSSAESVKDRVVIRLAGWLTAAAAIVLVGALLTRPAAPKMSTGSSDWVLEAVGGSGETPDESASDPTVQWMLDEFSTGADGETE